MQTSTSAPPAPAVNPTERRFSRGLREAFPCDFSRDGIEHYGSGRRHVQHLTLVAFAAIGTLLAVGVIAFYFVEGPL